MRKFSIVTQPDEINLTVKQHDSGKTTEIGTVSRSNDYLRLVKLTAKELSTVYTINELLRSKDLQELTPEEAAWMFDPLKERRRGKKQTCTPEELQKLSGFVVEKTIKPYYSNSK